METSDVRTAHLRALLEVSRALSSEIHLDRILVLIAEKVTHVMDSDRSTVFLYDESSDELWSIVAQDSFEIRFPASAGLAGHSAQSRVTLNVEDAYRDGRFNHAFDAQSGYRTKSVLCSPIVDSSGDLVGVIQTLNKRQGIFTHEDEELLEALCSHAAVAIERARLVESFAEQKRVETTLALARQIQMGILPRQGLSTGDRYQAFAHLQPAQIVGGDFFDLWQIDENRLGFAIGDVSGKGIPAAIFLHGIYTLLRQSLHHGRSPSHCFDQIHRIHRNESAIFVTIFYGILDLDSGVVTYSNAGHIPPLVVGADQSVASVRRAANLPLCITDPADGFREITFTLREGDTLILCTDGVLEARNVRGDAYGIERLSSLCAQEGAGAVEELAERVINDVEHFTGSEPQHDDLTFLIIRYT